VYYIVLWDNLPGEINFICTDDIISEEKDWLRDRITGYWKAKSPNFSLFNRHEVSLSGRLKSVYGDDFIVNDNLKDLNQEHIDVDTNLIK
jgi:hypothetical protein